MEGEYILDVNLNYNVLLLGTAYDKNLIISKCITRDIELLYEKVKEKAYGLIQVIGSWNNKIEYNENHKIIQIYSNNIPYNIIINSYKPDDIGNVNTQQDFNRYDKIVFISSWQYETYSMDRLVNSVINISNANFESMMVLFKDDINVAATDIGNKDNVMKQVCEKYSNLLDTIIFKNGDSLLKILRPRLKIKNKIKKEYCEDYKSWKDELLDEKYGTGVLFKDIDVIPVIKEEYIQPHILETHIYSLGALKEVNNRSDINAAFVLLFMKKEGLYQRAERIILNFYKETISKICIWEEKQDLDMLKLGMYNKFKECTEGEDKKYSIPANRTEYNLLELKNKVKAKFSEALNKYYTEEVWKILYNHMLLRSQQIDKLIGNFI